MGIPSFLSQVAARSGTKSSKDSILEDINLCFLKNGFVIDYTTKKPRMGFEE